MPQTRTRRTQDQLISMKIELFNKYLAKQLSRKDLSVLLKMHPNAVSRLASRYKQEGKQAFVPKKPGPKKFQPPNRTPEDIVDVITAVALKHPELGPKPLAALLAKEFGIVIEQTTVWRILKREKVRYTTTYTRWKDNPTLYCLDSPGQEVQLDACYPFGRSRPVASFDAIDDCSRFGMGTAYEKEDDTTAIIFATKVVLTAPFRVQKLRVDNRYGKRFKEYCENILGIEVIYNDPYTPKQNGKVERFHKTLKHEFYWKYVNFTDSLEQINYKYQFWLHHYNTNRPHSGYGMNGLTPAQKIALTYWQSTANTTLAYPQKVTSILQQYTY